MTRFIPSARWWLPWFVLLAAGGGVASASDSVRVDVDWSTFLGRHDPIWDRLPQTWLEGPFLGNGMMGTLIRQENVRAVRFDVGRCDVQDHRDDSYGMSMFTRCRLPIGYFTLETVGAIEGGRGRLDLYNAEATGTIRTDRGRIDYRSIVHAEEMLILVEIEPDAGERDCRFVWNAEQADSPRQRWGRGMDGYLSNPPARYESAGPVRVCIQPLLVGGMTATAWYERNDGPKRTLYVSVAHSFPDATAFPEAVEVVDRTRAEPVEQLIETHRVWWHAYWPASFVSVPDGYWEGFYWIQMYKLASATRGDRALIDLMGPWLQITPWPGAWWNLNVQLTYWPLYAANRLELADSLSRHLDRNRRNLLANVPPKFRAPGVMGIGRATGQDCYCPMHTGPSVDPDAYELCNLPWTLHNVWLQYRHAMDDKMLRDVVYPLLRDSINFYLCVLEEGEGGRYHLPISHSPEYGAAADCNIDLALLRWGCRTLIASADRLGIDEPLLPRWREVLERLVDYPTDENGFMIGRGMPYANSHRHFSHLLMIYPLYLVNVDQAGGRAMITRSLDHWQSLDDRFCGYSYTTGSSMAAALGDGNRALKMLDSLKRFLGANTMYEESGPCIETPLAGAQSVHDMLIQSWDGVLRVFPAVPDTWADVTIHNFRTEGAFLVSAARRAGKARFVRIGSQAGEPCRLQTNLLGFEFPDAPRTTAGRPVRVTRLADDRVELDLKKGEEIILVPPGAPTEPVVAPVALPGDRHRFGLPDGQTAP